MSGMEVSSVRLERSGSEALARLNALLPLAARQAVLPPAVRALHRAILRGLATQEELPALSELAAASGVADGAAALAQLQVADLVVVKEGGTITGAYPITLEPTAHRVTITGRTLFAMCAVDALAIGPMFGRDVRIESRCHACGKSIGFAQDDEHITPGDLMNELHVGIAWQETCGCAAHSLCREMVFFCSPGHAARWQQGAPERNCVLSLAQAMWLAKAFFLPLLAPPRET